MRDDLERLYDIEDAILKIERYSLEGRPVFDKNELVQTWIIHNLLIIGEASSKVSNDFQNKYPNIPWKKIIGMRNILIHHYFGINLDRVWSVVENDLTVLKAEIAGILQGVRKSK